MRSRAGWHRIHPGSTRRRKGNAMAERVRADMVGAVLSVLVHQDEKVQAGQTLVLLESMKMEIPAVPEGDGTVTRIAVRAGDVVQEGDLLVVVD